MVLRAFSIVAVIVAAFAFTAVAEAKSLKSNSLNVGNPTSVPYGWVDFCSRHAEECNVAELPASEVALSSKTYRDLNRINVQVNAFIEPVSNLEHWGTLLDHWDYPTDGKGDCKIYALYKRKLLMDLGYPRQALLMTVVKDLQGNGHAILTVKTSKGELVLDNLSDDIRSPGETGYGFIKRQSQENPNVWLTLSENAGAQASAQQ